MTITKDSVKGITGRTKLNDIEAILDIPEVDPNTISHFVKTNADSIFTWDYSSTKPQLHKLYEKAKVGQWNGNELPWNTNVDIEKVVAEEEANLGIRVDISLYGDSPISKWGDKEWLEFGIESRRWVLSQTLHGEQGAMIFASKIVETVPGGMQRFMLQRKLLMKQGTLRFLIDILAKRWATFTQLIGTQENY